MTSRHVVVQGCGRTGSALAASLVSVDPDLHLTLVDPHPGRAEALGAALGGGARSARASQAPLNGADLLAIALPAGAAVPAVRAALDAGIPAVATSDTAAEVAALLDSDSEAEVRGVTVVPAAGMAPGLSCLLARHGAALFDEVDEIHTAKAGTGGPACARAHHGALSERAVDWREGGWTRQRGGSGRQLAHFPEPVGPRDCYRAGLGEAMLLRRSFPGAGRITARMAATRRDRLTASLPMLRQPHGDGGPGAVRVEVWGRAADPDRSDAGREAGTEPGPGGGRGRGGDRTAVVVYGAVGTPSRIAGGVAATTVRWVLAGRFAPGVRSLADVDDPAAFLTDLAQLDIAVSIFEGAP